MQSHLTHLDCTFCGKTYSADELQTVCPACGKVLYARYDLEAARQSRGFAPASTKRYTPAMPSSGQLFGWLKSVAACS